MPWIEGVGDEVVQFVVVVIVMMVAALAWWSTNARPDRYRTVLVMRSRSHHPVTLSIQTRSTLMLSPTQTNGTAQATMSDTDAGSSTSEVIEEASSNSGVIPLQEMDSIVDAHMAMMDNNRLHFYRRIDSPSNAQSTAESTGDESEPFDDEAASFAQIREMDSIVSAMEADVTAPCDVPVRENESTNATPQITDKKDENKENTPSTADAVKTENVSTETGNTDVTANEETEGERRKILIKLKYLNDTLKEVEGSLDEMLKDFKWRHFSTELLAESRVRLIFNGRVLLDDAATLRACGLHHRAVVHCLVHPKSSANQNLGLQEEAEVSAHEIMSERAPPERSWDFENILMTLVSVALTVVWFFRCEYSNMFTASASVALFGLTVFYSVAIFGLYLSDTFQFDRRPAQVVPHN